MNKYLFVFISILIFCSIPLFSIFASFSIISQSISTNSAEPSESSVIFQTLGSGLSGQLGTIDIYSKYSGTPPNSVYIYFQCFNEVGMTTFCAGSQTSLVARHIGITIDSATKEKYSIDMGSIYNGSSWVDGYYQLDPDKYYKFAIYNFYTSTTIYGNNSNSYINGSAGVSSGTLGSLSDLYFDIKTLDYTNQITCENAGYYWIPQERFLLDQNGNIYSNPNFGDYYCSLTPGISTCNSSCTGCEGFDQCSTQSSTCNFIGNICVPITAPLSICGAGNECGGCFTEAACTNEGCSWAGGSCFDLTNNNTLLTPLTKAINDIFLVWNKAPLNYITHLSSTFYGLTYSANDMTDLSFSFSSLTNSDVESIPIPLSFFDHTISLNGSNITISDLLINLSRIVIALGLASFFWDWASWIFGFGSIGKDSEYKGTSMGFGT
jgi:hypothetical protein